MKVGGVENEKNAIFGPVVLRRGSKFLAFWTQPVWDLAEFHALCPEPVNRSYYFDKSGKHLDPQAPAFLEEMNEYKRRRWGYVMMKSLEPSKIEWSTVDRQDPRTWGLVEKELRDELGVYEFAQVAKLVDEANALDEDKLEENAKSFFQQLAEAESEKSCQSGGPASTNNSGLANASE